MKILKRTLKKPSVPKPKSVISPRKSWTLQVKDSFTALTAVVSFVAAVLGVLVLYAGNKGLFEDLAKDFYSWLYEEQAWNGLFNNYPEGFVDMASMNLSDTTLQLVLTNQRGSIDGVMSEKRLCKVGFPHDFKLVRGHVSIFGKTASITIWDIEQGYPKDYAEFTLKRDGAILDVTPKNNSLWFGKNTLRIAQYPDVVPDQAMKNLNGFCSEEMEALMKSLKSRISAKTKRE
jgi:hypothetical protein